MLPGVFQQFEVVYIFFATFFFSLSLSIGKRSVLAKIKNPPRFYGPGIETTENTLKETLHFQDFLLRNFL